jgi:hypothetical protein
MSNNRYNPFASAFRAAFSELTSDQAKEFYAQRAVEDFHVTIGVITALGAIAFYLGQECRQWMVVEPPTSSESCAIALNNANPSPLFLTKFQPVEVLSVSTVEPPTLPRFTPFGLLPPTAVTPSAVETRCAASVNRLNLSLKELKTLAKQKGLRGYSRMSRPVLLSLLAA